MEHAVSPAVVDRMAEILSFPSRDPHGDPIPTKEGELDIVDERPLSACKKGDVAHVQRIAEDSAEFLAFAKEIGVVPGAFLKIIESDTTSATVQIDIEGQKGVATIGSSAAAKILIHIDGKSE